MSHRGSFKAYKVTNILDGRTYIGITTQRIAKRWGGHLSWANTGRKGVLADAIREHGAAAFTVEHLASARTWDDLLAVEQALVAQEHTLVWDGGYNVTEGGEGRHGYIMPEGERQAIRDRFRGVPKSPEHRTKLSVAKTGYKTPPETKAKMSLAHRGKPHSREWVRRQAAAVMGIKRSAETRAKVSAARRAYEAGKRAQAGDQGSLEL